MTVAPLDTVTPLSVPPSLTTSAPDSTVTPLATPPE